MVDLAMAPRGKEMVLHRPDCPEVRAQAERGEPVITMLGCKEIPVRPGGNVVMHECLNGAT
jgi:predicted ATP-grasp superfamily ATP-dependent carboligase